MDGNTTVISGLSALPLLDIDGFRNSAKARRILSSAGLGDYAQLQARAVEQFPMRIDETMPPDSLITQIITYLTLFLIDRKKWVVLDKNNYSFCCCFSSSVLSMQHRT